MGISISKTLFPATAFAAAVMFSLMTGCSPKENPAPAEPTAEKPTAVEAYQEDMESMPSEEEVVLLPAETESETPADSTAPAADSQLPGADGLVKVVKPENTLEQLVNSAPIVVIDMNATWCGPCRKLGPYIERMAETFKDKGVSFFSADVDEVKDLAQQLGGSAIPDVRIFVKGKEFDKQVGCEPIELFGKIEEAVKSVAE